MEINREMKVKDSSSEPGHPNQNPMEAIGVKPLKLGVQAIMDRTGALDTVWPWACKCIADINDHCATPLLGWKTPISVRHGYTPDISAFLQCQFWQPIYFKVDEQSPCTKEAPGHWLGVSNTVGDAMTFDIYSDKSKRVIQKGAIKTRGRWFPQSQGCLE